MHSNRDSLVMVDAMSSFSDMETALGSEFDHPSSTHTNEKHADEFSYYPMCHHCLSGSFSDGTLYNNVTDFGSSDLHLGVEGTLFKTHKYVLKKFAKFDEHIKHIEENHPDFIPVIKMGYDKHREADFRNTFKILYASVIEGPFDFDPLVLASGLRIAALYEYPALKTFCMTRLETAPLLPIQRIQISRECGINSWQERAYAELSSREEALSEEEAVMLGINAFVTIAKRREEEQRRKAVDGAANKGKLQVELMTPFIPEKGWSEVIKNLETIDIVCLFWLFMAIFILFFSVVRF